MTWSWLDIAFPWIGGAAALVLLLLLFGSRLLQSDPNLPRWHDLVWLSWLADAVYLLHNVEEYGVDLLGHTHAFPNSLCATLKLPPYPACPIPPPFFLAVNLSLFWVVGPVAALLSRRHPLAGLSLYSVISINMLVHVASIVTSGHIYNPGLFTALVLFLPLSIWIARASFGRGLLPYSALGLLLIWGVFMHLILAASAKLVTRGLIGSTAAEATQIVNAGLLLFVTWLGERWLVTTPRRIDSSSLSSASR
ncbi:MAG TPA: HXXEE domain-containing protein [Bryobacteraceae bacterium]|nr:HXXEE domain-containing protein [Acidobacteriaceae bacterium]